MRVFKEEMHFHFIGEVFVYSFFANFSRLSLSAHARLLINLYTQGSYTSIIGSAQAGLAWGKVSRM
jgi:hypothetical protein